MIFGNSPPPGPTPPPINFVHDHIFYFFSKLVCIFRVRLGPLTRLGRAPSFFVLIEPVIKIQFLHFTCII